MKKRKSREDNVRRLVEVCEELELAGYYDYEDAEALRQERRQLLTELKGGSK
jgi:hypothetical protein